MSRQDPQANAVQDEGLKMSAKETHRHSLIYRVRRVTCAGESFDLGSQEKNICSADHARAKMVTLTLVIPRTALALCGGPACLEATRQRAESQLNLLRR